MWATGPHFFSGNGSNAAEDAELEDRIERLIAPTVESLGFLLVRVKMFAGPRRALQVMIERADGGAATIDDCAMVSRLVGAHLDAEDPVSGSYDLEVSSTGIDRPLVRRDDYRRFAGFEAMASIDPPIGGRRRFRGRIGGIVDGNVAMEQPAGDVVHLPFETIVEAQLVLSDELIGRTARAKAG